MIALGWFGIHRASSLAGRIGPGRCAVRHIALMVVRIPGRNGKSRRLEGDWPRGRSYSPEARHLTDASASGPPRLGRCQVPVPV